MKPTPPVPARHWTFLSNHAHVLVCLALDRHARLRDVAASVGITERAVQKIVSDLEEAGVIQRERSGRRNSYRLNVNVPLRHPLESHRTVGTLLALLLDRAETKRARSG
jgi:DNA-binding Lrp family transcriptional regulator